MGKPKLVYFPAAGRAAATRLVFAIGGVEFDDERIAGEEFGKRKAAGEFPFGSLPVLEVDGKVIAQSTTIVRYAAKLAGLYPENPVDAAIADMVVETLEELAGTLGPTFRLATVEEKIAARKIIVENQFPKYLNGLNKIFADSPLLGGTKPNFGDVALYSFSAGIRSGTYDGIPADLFDSYPALAAAEAAIKEHPAVKAAEGR